MQKIYLFFTFFYTYFVSIYEIIYLKQKNHDKINHKNNIETKGFQEIDLIENLDLKFTATNILNVNKYMEKNILMEDELFKLINYIFVECNLAEKIFMLTGYNYSIDFFILYKTFSIASSDEDKPWFANHWHSDKPFSKNTLKIIIPISDLDNSDYGGIQVLTKSKTQDIRKKKISYSDILDDEEYQMKVKKKTLLIFKPNICLHKAGNPKNNKTREQIMFQLNPSKKWKINLNISKKQNFKEPKFPIISYFLDKKINLN